MKSNLENMANSRVKKFQILNVGISAINMAQACAFIEEAIKDKRSAYVCVCPVSTIMECKRDARVLRSINQADLATPDGMPVAWIGKLQGYKNISRVYGPELTQNICGISVKKGYTHYFYGASQDTLNKLKERLSRKYPGLIIRGSFSPPFRRLSAEEDKRIVDEINGCNPDVLWVGLGSPKQDLWMYEHRGLIKAPVMIGVGAAFDFIAGTKPQAPPWIRDRGFEWLFRLLTEPKRLWRRYLVDCPLFIGYVALDAISKFVNRNKTSCFTP